jgi:sporulation protein YlmC with PRC-barrel domain
VRTNSIATVSFGSQSVRSQPQFLSADDTVESKPSVVNETAVRGILGRPVQGADGKEMGRVIDVIVDSGGRVRAAVIDFGGFLGVGSRKIAVDWSALRFDGCGKRREKYKAGTNARSIENSARIQGRQSECRH